MEASYPSRFIQLFQKHKLMWRAEFLPFLDIKDLSVLRGCCRLFRDFLEGKQLFVYMQEQEFDEDLIKYYAAMAGDCMTFRMLLEAAVKNSMFKHLNESAIFYEKTLGMENNRFIEGKVFDCQKSPMKFYNGLVKSDFLKTPVDFKMGGGIKISEFGQGFFKTVKKYFFFNLISTFEDIEQSFESMTELYGKCEGILIQY